MTEDSLKHVTSYTFLVSCSWCGGDFNPVKFLLSTKQQPTKSARMMKRKLLSVNLIFQLCAANYVPFGAHYHHNQVAEERQDSSFQLSEHLVPVFLIGFFTGLFNSLGAPSFTVIKQFYCHLPFTAKLFNLNNKPCPMLKKLKVILSSVNDTNPDSGD